MLPTPHTSYRLVELYQNQLRAEFRRVRLTEKSPIRMTHAPRWAWDHLRQWVANGRPNVRWPRLWRWSST
jgi:hypothetical protein